jgi:hypothetical protein
VALRTSQRFRRIDEADGDVRADTGHGARDDQDTRNEGPAQPVVSLTAKSRVAGHTASTVGLA